MSKRDDYASLDTGDTDFEGEDISIMRDEQGRASIVPRTLTRLTPDARQAVRRIQECAEKIHELQDQLDGLVVEAREEFEVSWNAVGWAIGTSGQNARKRWMDA